METQLQTLTLLSEEESVGKDVISRDVEVVSQWLYHLSEPTRHQVDLDTSLLQQSDQPPGQGRGRG